MREIARRYGFHFTTQCQCGGTLKVYLRKEDYQLIIMPNQNMWKLQKGGATIAKGDGQTLEEQIKC